MLKMYQAITFESPGASKNAFSHNIMRKISAKKRFGKKSFKA